MVREEVHGGCVQRIEVILKMWKKSQGESGWGWGPVGGFRVDVYEELKLL